MTTNPITQVVNLLKNNWNAGNARDITPSITEVIKEKRVPLDTGHPCLIVIYSTSTYKEEYIDFRRDYSRRFYPLQVDIRYAVPTNMTFDAGLLDFYAVFDEVRRILQTNRKTPGAEFTHIYFGGPNDLSNKSTRLLRFVISVELREIVATPSQWD